MDKRSKLKKYIFLSGVLFLFPLLLIFFFAIMGDHHFNTLPYKGKYTVSSSGDTLFEKIPAFNFTNQEGQVYTTDSLKGKVWLASFFATNSPHIRKITSRLLWPNWRYKAETDILLVSFTLDPGHDTPAVMKAYTDQATKYHPHEGKWQFLTGDKDSINTYLEAAFGLHDPENTALMYLVDTEGYIRGEYNANLEEQMQDAIEDIALLKKEIDIKRYEEKKRSSNH
ncbi:MAG: hypothetical protein RL226_438 [Bacteroidota bacterium]|jgi:protein SCO1/2